jgi:hypothetical protein
MLFVGDGKDGMARQTDVRSTLRRGNSGERQRNGGYPIRAMQELTRLLFLGLWLSYLRV